MHLHSILWFGLGVAVTTYFYRRIMGPTAVAGLAVLLFALDDAHGFPVAWIANRNGVISFCLGMITLFYFVQWRQTKQRRARNLALLCFGLTLLAAEAGVAALPYLVAYLLILDRETIANRVRALAPFLLIFLLWLAIHRLLGYGERGTGLYLDPLSAPLYFLRSIVERVPILLLSQWALPPAGLYAYLPVSYQQGWWVLAVIVVGGIAYALGRALRHDRIARFWAIGMGLALIVACTSQPGERLLWFVGIGGMGLLAQWMAKLWHTVRTSAVRSMRRRFAWSTLLALGLIHFIHAPIFLSREARLMAAGATIAQAIDSLPVDEAFRMQTAVVVNEPLFFYSSYALPARSIEAKPFPLRLRHLVSTFNAIEITRPSANQLLIRPQGGFLVEGARLARAPTMPIALAGAPWARFELTDMIVEVTSIDEQGQPNAALFTFAMPLEDPAIRWLTWDQATGKFVDFPLPAIGATIKLPPLVEF
ncbi:MAG: hypothetical protein R3C14_40065 [Caldilineaceae bacterium]